MVKQLTELEQLKLKVSNLEYQITEYQDIVAELSRQLKQLRSENGTKDIPLRHVDA